MAPDLSFRRVLIANRGEIAVRIIRACRDAGLVSVAVFAEPDAKALHVRLADLAVPLGGRTAPESYLDIDKLIAAARQSGADAVHPGYGFLSESADFAQAVVDAGMTWIGPSAKAIRSLGDKVSARRIAIRAGAPVLPGTSGPVVSADEAMVFASQHGLPIAIKAAFGGGGRGLKIARSLDEIPERYDSAVREAQAAFGRGDCFVESYLEFARHVEAQILADRHGHVVVVGTRDCTLQRRHQKLVEEAPAPFLTSQQRQVINEAARAICIEAHFDGAGTVEFLVGRDGMVAFLEVNTRLQVEHTVSEETSGIDLVREQFHIAAGGRLPYTTDLEARGHSIEFRINVEDPARDFAPHPGVVRQFTAPAGPGVRVDAGVENGSVVGDQFDSLIAKLVVTGADRQQALERARRALAEMVVEGPPTVLSFHRSVINDPAFAATEADRFTVHTRWIETDWHSEEPEWSDDAATGRQMQGRRASFVSVGGRRMRVSVPAEFEIAPSTSGLATDYDHAVGGDVLAPMQGTIVKVSVITGQQVLVGDVIAVVEAMKMENAILAHQAGVIQVLHVAAGSTIAQGEPICAISD